MDKQRWEESEKRKSQRKEDAGARKDRKVAIHSVPVFPRICGFGGSKSRLSKATGAEPSGQMRDEKLHAVVARSTCRTQNVQSTPLSERFWKLRCRKSARRCGAKPHFQIKIYKTYKTRQNTLSVGQLLEVEMSKKCTPLRREAHFQIKNYKTYKTHQNTSVSDNFWKLRCRKSARRCGTKHISNWKCTKHTRFGALVEVEMSKKCTPLWREAHFQVKMLKTTPFSEHFWKLRCRKKCIAVVARSTFPHQNVKSTTCSDHFWRFRCGFAWQAQGILHLCQKWAKREGFCSISKNDGRCGTFEEDLKDAFRVACAVQETCSSEMLGGQGADFLRGVALWSIKSSGLLRWFCVTGAALRMTWHHFFVAGAALYTEGVEKSQNAFGRRQSDLPFLKEVEVSQNFLVFDVVIVEDWGSPRITLHYTHYTTPQLQLQLHYTNYTTLQLQLHYTTTTVALHHTTSSSCWWGCHCNHCSNSKKHNSNHLSVHQWIRSAIRDWRQPTSPIGFLFLKLQPPPCAVLLVYDLLSMFEWSGTDGCRSASTRQEVRWQRPGTVSELPAASFTSGL